MKPTLVPIRVFLASPGDVADERALVRHLLKEELPYDPFLRRGRMTFDVVSWDNQAARTPMPARLTPQEAVIRCSSFAEGAVRQIFLPTAV